MVVPDQRRNGKGFRPATGWRAVGKVHEGRSSGLREFSSLHSTWRTRFFARSPLSRKVISINIIAAGETILSSLGAAPIKFLPRLAFLYPMSPSLRHSAELN